MPDSFGQWLRARRTDLGLTRVQLAHSAGVTEQTLANIETGRTTASDRVLAAIAEPLHCTKWDLTHRRDQHQPSDAVNALMVKWSELTAGLATMPDPGADELGTLTGGAARTDAVARILTALSSLSDADLNRVDGFVAALAPDCSQAPDSRRLGATSQPETSGGANPTMERIAAETARRFGVTIDDLKGPSRGRRETLPRQIAMYLCRELLTEPYGTIAEYFDRDHTDALRAHRKVEQLRRTDAAIADDLALILLHVTPGSQPHRR